MYIQKVTNEQVLCICEQPICLTFLSDAVISNVITRETCENTGSINEAESAKDISAK